jgi:UDP-arabinose 4-epimerase
MCDDFILITDGVTVEMADRSELSILVTGGAGYVRAHTCKVLSRFGYKPVVFDNLSTGHRRFVRWRPLIEGDIRDHAAVLDAIRAYDVNAVLHFAALTSVGESVTDPQKYYENNVGGSLSLLRAMLDAGCRILVFSSSCAVYGEPQNQPIGETSPIAPCNPYGASKSIVERILFDYTQARLLNSISLRYFNASGADPEGELGELHDPETKLIPRAMMAIQGRIADFVVFGTDYNTPDGTAIRDYIHVSDLAEAHVFALRRLFAGEPSGVFNLGAGRGYSVLEVLNAISSEAGVAVRPASASRRQGDPPALIADATLSRSELGFSPKLSDLQTIIQTAWNWHTHIHQTN